MLQEYMQPSVTVLIIIHSFIESKILHHLYRQLSSKESTKINETKRTNQSVLLISSSSFKLVTSRLLSPRIEGGEREDLATPASFASDDGVGSQWLMTRHIGYIRTYIQSCRTYI